MPHDPASPDTSAPLLAVDRLCTGFDTRHGLVRVLDDVSFTVRRGETVALVGESGSGKTMTAQAILGVIPPPGRVLSGAVTFEGRSVLALPETEMRRLRGARISMIFQEPSAALNPVFTVGDQVAEVLIVHGLASRPQATARAIEMLAAVRIPGAASVARAYPHELSGGLRQRVLVGMALVCRPALVLADEPTSALDATIQGGILDLLREMKAQYNLALLLITHDMGMVAEMADRVMVMYAGRIVEDGPTDLVFNTPAHPYTKALLQALAGRERGQRLPSIDGSVPDMSSLPVGCAFGPRCTGAVQRCRSERPESRLLRGTATSDPVSPTSDSGLRTSDSVNPTSDFGLRTPDSVNPTSDFGLRPAFAVGSGGSAVARDQPRTSVGGTSDYQRHSVRCHLYSEPMTSGLRNVRPASPKRAEHDDEAAQAREGATFGPSDCRLAAAEHDTHEAQAREGGTFGLPAKDAS